jgi:hypothetical protein
MTHVRAAIVKASDVPQSVQDELLGKDYSNPRGLVHALHVVTGSLALKDAEGPSPGDLSRLELDVIPPKPVATDSAPGEVSFSPKLTALNLPENLELRNLGVGVRAAHASNFRVTDVQIDRASETQASTTNPEPSSDSA